MPKVSVIMPAYNAEKYIADAIDSILSQTYDDFEFIILNDCSKDRTEEIILSYDDPRIVYLKNEENLGVAATLNKGLASAKGEYIARMDADDISMPQRFAKQVTYLDANDDIAVLGSSVARFSDNKDFGIRKFACDPESMAIDMLFACGLAHPSVMMRAGMIRGLGGYDVEFNGLEDYELWCRVLERHSITTLPEVLLRYRIHNSQVTQNPSAHYLDLLQALKIRQCRQLGLEPDQAGAFFQYCQYRKLDTPEEIEALDDFFALVDKTNAKKHIYDHKKMQMIFQSVMRVCILQVPRPTRYHLVKVCRFFKMREWIWFNLKQKVKKLIGYAPI